MSETQKKTQAREYWIKRLKEAQADKRVDWEAVHAALILLLEEQHTADSAQSTGYGRWLP